MKNHYFCQHDTTVRAICLSYLDICKTTKTVEKWTETVIQFRYSSGLRRNYTWFFTLGKELWLLFAYLWTFGFGTGTSSTQTFPAPSVIPTFINPPSFSKKVGINVALSQRKSIDLNWIIRKKRCIIENMIDISRSQTQQKVFIVPKELRSRSCDFSSWFDRSPLFSPIAATAPRNAKRRPDFSCRQAEERYSISNYFFCRHKIFRLILIRFWKMSERRYILQVTDGLAFWLGIRRVKRFLNLFHSPDFEEFWG